MIPILLIIACCSPKVLSFSTNASFAIYFRAIIRNEKYAISRVALFKKIETVVNHLRSLPIVINKYKIIKVILRDTEVRW